MQQFSYTRGKNSTDSALIIDAMDLLYAGNVEGFVIVSSDSDFTRLATRLRESGKTVYGLGRRTTPEAFVAACDRFIYLDLVSAAEPQAASELPDLEQLLSAAIGSTSKDDGWSNLLPEQQQRGLRRPRLRPRQARRARPRTALRRGEGGLGTDRACAAVGSAQAARTPQLLSMR
jgi:hypothetical protein